MRATVSRYSRVGWLFQPGVVVRLPWGRLYELDAGGAGVFDSALRFLETGACDIAWREGKGFGPRNALIKLR